MLFPPEKNRTIRSFVDLDYSPNLLVKTANLSLRPSIGAKVPILVAELDHLHSAVRPPTLYVSILDAGDRVLVHIPIF
jgi:hypothetical protein